MLNRDMIDREALIEDVFDHCVSMSVCLSKDECDGMKRMRDAIMEDIENAPSIDPWIPVTEQLPKDTTCVLVTDGEWCAITNYKNGEWDYYDAHGNHLELYGEITHWTSLPTTPLYKNINCPQEIDEVFTSSF